MQITHCEDCDNLESRSRQERREYSALCMAHPRLVRADLVFHEITDKDPPYMYCRHINGGACPMFQPVKHATEKDEPT